MENSIFRAQYGPWAVVAGASEGLGAAFARAIAAQGIHLVLVARRADMLNQLADELRKAHGIEVETAVLDLASETIAEDVQPYVGDHEIGLCVYNAAYSIISPFPKMSMEDKLRHIRVNCHGPVIFTTLFGEAMVKRGKGGMILMSSVAGLRGSELLTMYSATKAFNTNLAEGLWQEYRQVGVDVLGVIAGAISTPNYNNSRALADRFTPPPQDPDDLARKALEHLGRGYPVWRSNWQVGLADLFLTRLLPRVLAVRFFSRTTRNLYPHFR